MTLKTFKKLEKKYVDVFIEALEALSHHHH